jgi:N-acyl amino acid synthase FeeM
MWRVSEHEEWNRVRRIRYDALRACGEIAQAPEPAYRDRHDATLNSMTFGLLYNGRMIGTTRSSVSSAACRWPLPAHDSFARAIDAGLGADATIVESSLMLVDPCATADPRTALFHLFRAHMLHCASEGADWLICAVRDSQAGFYRRMFNMEVLSGAQNSPVLDSPRVLMGLAYRDQAALLARRMPLLATTGPEEHDFASGGLIEFRADRRATPRVSRGMDP